jgi:maltooligosyltrehalose trehalohydrolase
VQLQPVNVKSQQPSSTGGRGPSTPRQSGASDTFVWTFEYDARGLTNVSDLALKGSFNAETGQLDPHWNNGQTVPLRDDGKGGDAQANDGIYTTTVALQGNPDQKFEWGVVGTNHGKQNQWLIMQEAPLQCTLGDPVPVSAYAPVSNHLFGVHNENGDVRFQTWAPALGQDQLSEYKLHVDLFNDKGELERSLPMEKNPKTGDWSLRIEGGWQSLEGKTYKYSARDEQGEILKNSKGDPVTYADPCSRHLMGQQRGLERIFVDPVLGMETGWYDDSGKGGPNYADNPQFGRFVVDNHGDARNVQLVLRDEEGRQLTKTELIERLGEPKFTPYEQASAKDQHDVNVLKQWTLANSPKIESYLWTNSVNEDGSIEMKKVETNRTGDGWTVAVNNFPKLVGLSYEFKVWTTDGTLKGDLDGNGDLSPEERVKTAFNEPWDNKISPTPGSARRSLIRESKFEPKFGDTPRIENDFRKKVIFELHLGSFLGPKDNGLAPTAEDLVANLDYLQELGATDIYMMPTSEFGAKRDWGYTTDHFFAGADAYGFEMPRAQAVEQGLIDADEAKDQESVWVKGTEAIQWLNDQLHARGFNTMGDVVYNHTSGKPDGDNPLNAIDGDANSFFKWNGKHSSTPWGHKPAFVEQGVKNFFANNAAQQITEMGFDNLRFDFTQVLHNTGDAGEQIEGMNTLRQINRTLQAIKPGTVTVAEDFSRNWLVAADLDRSEHQHGVEKKGMGFQGVWNDGVRESIYKGIEGKDGEYNMDRLMHSMQHHYGVSDWSRGVLYAHSHDEVGNSGKWVARAAAGSKDDIMGSYARAASRSGAALTLMGPGMPMLWQGEEFLANNDFKHGLTSTWGYDTNWLNFKITPDRLDVFKRLAGGPGGGAQPPLDQSSLLEELRPEEKPFYAKYQAMDDAQKAQAEDSTLRAGHFKSYKDLIALRRSSDAFMATAPVTRIHTHNADRVIAFGRGEGDEQFVVVTNLAGEDRHGYNVQLPPGQWKEVLNTNAREYGGTGVGNAGATIPGGAGMTLPAGSTIVLKKV